MDRRLGVYRTAAVAAIIVAALFAFTGGAYAADNSGCLTCHSAGMSMPVPDVDRDAVCESCHVGGLVGTHPYHQAGSNCGSACHPGWGDSLMTAVPTYTDPVSGAAFASATSKATSPAVLHIIHSDARWPQGVDASFSACSSCHAPAACTACHTGAVSANHTDHSATGNANYLAQLPWTGTVGRGVPGGDQTQHTAGVETNQCASAGCHDIESTKSNRPKSVEDYNYTAGQNPDDLAGSQVGVISLVGTWRYKASSVYSGSRMSYNNIAGSQLNATFTGKRVELVSDKDPYRGRADVFIDGAKVATIDTYAASTVYQAVVYSSDVLSTSGPHTISVRPLNTKVAAARAAYIVVDSFRVYIDVPASIAPECLSCHGDKSSGHGATFSHEATHAVGVEGGFACTSCHSLNMFTEHGRTTSSSDAAGCSACHTTYAPFVLTEYDFTCGGTANTLDGAAQPCHNNATEIKHEYMVTGHDASGVANGADCKGCHGSDLSTIHTEGSARPYNTALAGNSFAVSCLSCHSTTAVPTTKDCTSSLCHNASFGGAAVTMDNHVPVAHPATNAGQTDVTGTGGFACSTCHTLELTTEHVKATSLTSPGNAAIDCSNCHSAAYFPTDWMGATNTCTACHPTAGGEAGMPHEAAEYTSKHDFSATSSWDAVGPAGCSGMGICHDVSAVDLIHNGTPADGITSSCVSCHATPNAVPTADACVDCHSAHPGDGPVHDPQGTPVRTAANADCLTCHTNVAASVTSSHPGGCFGCHNNGKLTKYLQNNYDMVCTDCHNSTMEIGWGQVKPYYDYTFSSTNPTYESAHYDTWATSHDATGMTTVIANKTCASCHANNVKVEHLMTASSGSIQCFECHTSSAPVDAASVIAADWPNSTCSDCHAATHDTMAAGHTLAGGAGCEGSDCHADTADVATLHLGAVDGAETSCNVCHTSADTDLSAITGCDSCHAGHDLTALHLVSPDTGNCLRCHEKSDNTPTTDLRDVHPACSTCHGNPVLTGGVAGKGTDCVNCHNASVIPDPHPASGGVRDPYDPNMYVGTEATHTADGFDVGFTTTGGFACSSCHNLEMRPEHFKNSSAFPAVPGTYPDKCVGCHEAKVDGLVGHWNKRCVACHTTVVSHADATIKHDVTASSCTENSGCHSNDASVIHADSISSNSMTPDCQTCHTNNTTVPTELDCGAVGCHAGMSAHAHTLDVPGSAGCTSSGAGCHDSADTNYASEDYHPANGCTSGACHTAANHSDSQFDDPNTCQNCHDGSYNGAPNTAVLTNPTPNGHYPNTLHDIGAFLGVVKGTSDGTTSAYCNDCHSRTAVAGVGGLHKQHQGLGDKGDVTCQECHNSYPAVVADSWSTPSCGDCHTGPLMPDPGDTRYGHTGNIAPTGINGTGTGCVTSGCHATWDLHTLHKGNGGASDPTCNESGCHDYTKQGQKPTTTACASAGCHDATPTHPGEDAAHTATATSNECVECHEASDIRIQHGGVSSCGVCHNAGDNYGGTGNTADCVQCHNSSEAGTYDYTGHTGTSAHYTSNSTTHTASFTAGESPLTGSIVTPGGWGTNNYSIACASCHLTDLMGEHVLTNATITGYADKCVGCHEIAVDDFTQPWVWNDRCDACHTGAAGLAPTRHGAMATKHDASGLGSPGSSTPTNKFTDPYTTNDFATKWTVTSWARQTTGGSSNGAAMRTGGVTTTTSARNTTALSTAGYSAAELRFWYKESFTGATEYLAVQYGTATGGPWTELWRVTGDVGSATGEIITLPLPAGALSSTLYIRFESDSGSTTRYAYVDDVYVDAITVVPATGAAACGSPASDCHDLTDVSKFHAYDENGDGDTADSGEAHCDACHTGSGSTQRAATLDCSNANCHGGTGAWYNPANAGLHRAYHDVTTAATADGSTSGRAAAEVDSSCVACHEPKLDSDHWYLSQAGTRLRFDGNGVTRANDCAPCHRKTANSVKGTDSAITGVTALNTRVAISTDRHNCTVCHTATAWNNTGAGTTGYMRMHENRGTVTPVIPNNTEFNDTYSGHRAFAFMDGQVLGLGGGGTYTFNAYPTQMFKTGVTLRGQSLGTTTMTICTDCHTYVGATGPHGAAMTIKLGDGSGEYDGAWAGASGAMLTPSGDGISPTTVGSRPICAKCHDIYTSSWGNTGHNDHDDRGTDGQYCTQCHVRVTHAWKRPRLLARYGTDPAAYLDPAWTADGLRAVSLQNQSANGWNENDCTAGCSLGRHTVSGTAWP